MISDFPEKLKGILLNPVETFQKLRDEEFSDAFKYYIMILVVYIILSAILSVIGLSAFAQIPGIGAAGGAGFIIGSVIGGLIGGIVGLFIGGVILHIFVIIAGGKKGLMQTLKALAYASTPVMIIGWIPVLNLIAGIWGIILEVLAIREMHEISTGKAVLAVILPAIIILILMVAAIGYLLI